MGGAEHRGDAEKGENGKGFSDSLQRAQEEMSPRRSRSTHGAPTGIEGPSPPNPQPQELLLRSLEPGQGDVLHLPDDNPEGAFQPAECFVTTVLFCDIRGFTKLLEHAVPEQVFYFVRKFLHALTSAVTGEGGTVNNLTGDGFLAHFRTGPDQTHALRAVNCAIEMRARLGALNQERHRGKNATFTVGIGIHTGAIAAGPVRLGSHKSILLVGTPLNIASRIENLTKEFSVDILVSAETYDCVKTHFTFLTMPSRAVKGRTDKLNTFWIPPHATAVRKYPPTSPHEPTF